MTEAKFAVSGLFFFVFFWGGNWVSLVAGDCLSLGGGRFEGEGELLPPPGEADVPFFCAALCLGEPVCCWAEPVPPP